MGGAEEGLCGLGRKRETVQMRGPRPAETYAIARKTHTKNTHQTVSTVAISLIPRPNQPQHGSLPVSHTIPETIHAGWVCNSYTRSMPRSGM